MATEKSWESIKSAAISRLRSSGELSGSQGALQPLIKEIIETALEAELEDHIACDTGNRKNGKVRKQVKSDYGAINIETSRDRNGSFEPKLIKKRQRTLGNALDQKILALWGKGMSYSDIKSHIEEMYGMELSEATLSTITDSIVPKLKEWQNRPLDSVYPVVWLDAIHFKVKEDGRIVNKAVYGILGVNKEGIKELLGMYIGGNESASFWLQVLTELNNRGVEDILIACIDNLTGFKDAIASVFPLTEIQQCIVHQVRNSMKFIPEKDRKEFLSDLKSIYKSDTEDLANHHLDTFCEKWESKYPPVIKSWRGNWEELSAFFKYHKSIRKIIYTTNPIESFHSQIRKVTKTKRVFFSDMALMKLLYLVQKDVTKKWSMPMHNWKHALMQFSIIFGDRLKLNIGV